MNARGSQEKKQDELAQKSYANFSWCRRFHLMLKIFWERCMVGYNSEELKKHEDWIYY